ncbi:MAG: DUF2934 domain-containing protein [Chloroflexi bacterium]|nr:DUF2934 domain-containing protein [Chloroflexota bacterium]
MVTEQKIRELAYQIWEREGRPHGRDLEHYVAAKRLIEEQESATHTNGSDSYEAPAAQRGAPAAPAAVAVAPEAAPEESDAPKAAKPGKAASDKPRSTTPRKRTGRK